MNKNGYQDDYEELSALLQYKQDLTTFFSENRDYKSILDQAINDNHKRVISALSKNLPLNDWFDKEHIFNQFKKSIEDFPFSGSLYTWCMNIPEVRQCFSPKEKGQFLRIGFALGNHEMAYSATLDHDWKENLSDDIVKLELERLSKEFMANFYEGYIKLDYVNWFETEVFQQMSEKSQVVYMLGILTMSVGQLRMISENKNLAEIGFHTSVYDERDNPFEKLDKTEKELKNVINHTQTNLCFNGWPNDLRYKFVCNNLGYIPKGAVEIIEKDYLHAFADKLTTLINYKKLSNELSVNDELKNRKLKI
jgi:hypothetical protein